MAGLRPLYTLSLCLTLTLSVVASTEDGEARDESHQEIKHLEYGEWAEEEASKHDATLKVKRESSVVRNGTEPLLENGTEPHVRDGTEPHVRDGTEPHVRDGTEPHVRDGTEPHVRDGTELHVRDGAEPHVGNGTEPHFETPGLKRHYETWMKMIMESDYVQGNRTDNNTTDDDPRNQEHQEPTQDDENNYFNERLRVLQQVVSLEERNAHPQPYRINDRCHCGLYNSHQTKIVGGLETHKHHYPWMVSIQLIKNGLKIHFCGGSIISDTFVLTAAHCVDGLLEWQLEMRIGDHDLTTSDVSREQSFPVEEIIRHPRYNPKTTDSDIALLRLANRLQLTWRVNPICLTPQDLTYYKEQVIVMGWGKEKEGDKMGSPRLKHAVLKVLPMGKCRKNFKFFPDEITSNMFCALRGTMDTCQGDSGGPLTWFEETHRRYFLIGVTSWGIGCGLPDYPGVYTKITNYLDWIYEQTQKSTFCSSYTPKPHRKKIKKDRNKQKPKFFKKLKALARGKNNGIEEKRNKKITGKSMKKKRQGRKLREGKSLVDKDWTKSEGNFGSKQTKNFKKKKANYRRKQRKQQSKDLKRQKKSKRRKQRNNKFKKTRQSLRDEGRPDKERRSDNHIELSHDGCEG